MHRLAWQALIATKISEVSHISNLQIVFGYRRGIIKSNNKLMSGHRVFLVISQCVCIGLENQRHIVEHSIGIQESFLESFTKSWGNVTSIENKWHLYSLKPWHYREACKCVYSIDTEYEGWESWQINRGSCKWYEVLILLERNKPSLFWLFVTFASLSISNSRAYQNESRKSAS